MRLPQQPRRRLRPDWLVLGALSGALTVALGAFGAHALAERLDARELELWRTAVLYQGLHAPALGLVGLLAARSGRGSASGWAFAAGTLVFAGTLYAMALGGPRWLGAITPLGGTALIAGWLLLAHAARGAGRGGLSPRAGAGLPPQG
jgi:uncharacterized membrane protein YgdD (TMEM256/DUF423 family)